MVLSMNLCKFGNIKANDIIVIDNYIVKAALDFNIYHIKDELIKSGEFGVREFVYQLDPLIADAEVTDEEQIAFGDDINRADRVFLSDTLPTEEQMIRIGELIPEALDLIHRYQLEVIATGLDVYPDECEFTIGELLERNIDGCTTNKAALHQMVTVIDIYNIRKKEQVALDNGEHLIYCVPLEFSGVACSYTYGVYNRLGFELVVVNPAARSLGHALNVLVERLLEAGADAINKPDIADNLVRFNGGVVGRCKLIKVLPEFTSIKEDLDFNPASINGHKEFYQLIVADTNNVFPDEEGYDSRNFCQPILPMA